MLAGGASNVGEIHLELNQPNQDNYFLNDTQHIYAVFDGHGEHGHEIASFLKKHLATTFTEALHPSTSIAESFRKTFRALDDTICKSNQSESSGSTCAVAYIVNDLLYLAGVGDCTAMLAQVDPSNSNVTTTTLLPAHKLTNVSELARITKTGAQMSGDYVVCKTDPHKVINMTRSFGDQDMKSSGIISIPAISVIRLSSSKHSLSVEIGDGENNDANHALNGASTISDNTTHNVDSNANGNAEDVKQIQVLGNGLDNFLVLSSDGLDQVDLKEIARQTHHMLKKRVESGKEAIDMSTLCSQLLQKLEDDLYERDGMGFSDDATILVVPLSGFVSTTT